MNTNTKSPAAIVRFLPWILIFLAVISFGGAFMGADLAREFFAGPAMAMVWILLDVLALAALVIYLGRKRWIMAGVALSVCLILTGAMASAPAAANIARRLGVLDKTPLARGYMPLVVGQKQSVIYAKSGQPTGELDFTVTLDDFGSEYSTGQIVMVGNGRDIFAGCQLVAGSEMAYNDSTGARRQVKIGKCWLDGGITLDDSAAPYMSLVSPDGVVSSCYATVDAVLSAVDGKINISVAGFDDSASAFGTSGGGRTLGGPHLLLRGSGELLSEPTEFPLAMGQSMELPGADGWRIYLSYPNVAPQQLDVDEADLRLEKFSNYLKALELYVDGIGPAYIYYHDDDLPLVRRLEALDGADELYIHIKYPSAAVELQRWARISFSVGDGSDTETIRGVSLLNKPVSFGKYGFYINSFAADSAGVVMLVSYQGFWWLVFAGQALMCVCLAALLVKRVRSRVN